MKCLDVESLSKARADVCSEKSSNESKTMRNFRLWVSLIVCSSMSVLAQTPASIQAQPRTAPRTASLDQALNMYAVASGKTILISSSMPAPAGLIIPELPSDKAKDIETIEAELSKHGIEVVQDGPHFVRVIRKGEQNQLTNAPLHGSELKVGADHEILRTGAINFSGIDVEQVLSIYAALRGRTILRPASFRAPSMRLKTSCPLTQEEAIYAMNTVLALNGVSAVDDGVKLVQVVNSVDRGRVKALAPKPQPGEASFDPKKVPSMGHTGLMRVTPRNGSNQIAADIEKDVAKLRKLFYDFIHQTDPNTRPAHRLLSLYAAFPDKKAVLSEKLT